MRLAASVALVVLATPAAADPIDPATPTAATQLGVSYMMGRPATGDAGGADHALVVRGERRLRPDLGVGLVIEGGYAPGNDDETLRRLAILPAIGVRGELGVLTLRADFAFGWQLLDGRTRLGNVPVAGAEARGLRAEVGIGLLTSVGPRVLLHARAGLAIDAVFPVDLVASKQLGPFVELGAVLAL